MVISDQDDSFGGSNQLGGDENLSLECSKAKFSNYSCF